MANYKPDRKTLTDEVPISITLCGYKQLKEKSNISQLPAYRCGHFPEWKNCIEIDFEINERGVFLITTIRFPQYEHGSITYKIEVIPTRCNYGGIRWWFICPITGGKCLKLYFNGSIGSREGLGLKYASQLETKQYRSYKQILTHYI